MTNKIDALTPTNVNNLTIKHELLFTIMDGKVNYALSETSSHQRCNCCNLTSKSFNDLKLVADQIEDGSGSRSTIAILHAWIRLFEWYLKVGYKVKLKSYIVPNLLKGGKHGNMDEPGGTVANHVLHAGRGDHASQASGGHHHGKRSKDCGGAL